MNRSRLALYGVFAVVGATLAWLTRPLPETYLPQAPVAERGVRQAPTTPRPSAGGSAQTEGARSALPSDPVRPDAVRGSTDSSDADDPSRAGTQSLEETAESLTHRLARTLYARSGRQFVASLVEQGLAEADSIVIVRQAMDRIAACVVDALRTEAEEQSLRFDVLLLALDAVISDADVPEAEAMLTTATIESRTVPCIYAVAQEAGIAVP